ncbi:helix-turn-helix domain-containing protein [Micromonospora sagamiensis]|uniref:Helix-turn-helix protein n=1 Tax=Micromonospora sagamiensis TaxID=47875 RepID=A0A562WHJ4_9ACTN|nr:helix-turn-helix transcriptional regulator [Micromonospora sagamiensis]TWJ29618.1 helix-turn-helix protein [Micromonospora sagamiensis]BCL17353.1 transcriptional regulator [Micromonospora sagamiensis]
MTEDGASTVPRRQLGRMLRELRLAAGVTLDAAAVALQCSRQKVWRIETGGGPVRGVDVRAMCELYGVAADLTAALVALAGETRAKGWWHAYAEVPAWLGLYAGLEATARRLREYADAPVPALLQTPGYARALHDVDPELTDDDRDRLVAARLDRQNLLRRRLPPPPRLDVVLSEAVLLRVAGGPATMAAQLRHLREVTALPHVSVRVLPLAAGLPDGAEAGSFTLLEFPFVSRAVPEVPVVYQESVAGALYLDRPAELAAYERVWASLDSLALDPEESRRLIGKIAEQVHGG